MRVPLQHLVGRQAFWRHEFEVSGDALIPRPETELLVEEALRLLAGIESPLVLDVGTGTGCIALSIATERPDARVFAGDISSRALAMATRNAHRIAHGRVAFVAADLLAAWAEAPLFDLILSNPPYAAASDAPSLAPEVRDHEPGTALFGGEDGLAIYRRLLPQSRPRLKPEGHLVLEIGMGQEDAVRTLAGACGLDVLRVLPDLQTIPRVLVAKPAS
jgi:release factor glutamine methyltransferase